MFQLGFSEKTFLSFFERSDRLRLKNLARETLLQFLRTHLSLSVQHSPLEVLRVSERRKCAKKDKRCRGSERGGRPHVASLTSSTSSSESLRYSGSASVPTTRRAPRRSSLPRPLSAPPIAVRLQWRKKKAPNERARAAVIFT